ncbi:MAG: hypothetical protein Q8J88_11260 [Bacteroidales bacterium]|nr:hypothetical protein [Bacteroidales bacterium]
MKNQFVNFGLLFVDGVYSLVDNATIFTNDDAEIIDFATQAERDEYLIENEIVYEVENLPDFNDPQ